jgi:hypothetical protein
VGRLRSAGDVHLNFDSKTAGDRCPLGSCSMDTVSSASDGTVHRLTNEVN